jgi:alkylation response protein AidB-like acyl-CoA dehydrogenase
MDLRETAEERAFRASIRDWLAKHLSLQWGGEDRREPAQLFDRFAFRRKWHRKMYQGGWLGLHWPKQYGGRGLSLIEQLIANEELAKAEAPQIANWVGVELVGPTLIRWSSEAQKRAYLPRILNGSDVWCQAWSEPGAGSDLTAISTTATEDGDGWIINGAKRWISWAQFAHFCIVLARVGDPQLRHRSLACFIVPLDAQGVTVNPIPMMNGEAEENDVIFDAVRVPRENLVGPPSGGWNVVLTAMGLARGTATLMRAVELEVMFQKAARMAKLMPDPEDCALSRPRVRRQLVRLQTRIEALKYLAYRKIGDLESSTNFNAVASTEKLVWSRLSQELTELALHIQGPHALIASNGSNGSNGSEETWPGFWRQSYLRAKANAIEGGTDEIQKNTIAKQILGMSA